MPFMLGTIIRNLVTGPATRRYPFKDIREPFPGFRGRIVFDTDKCVFCGDCARVCPSQAIEVDTDRKELKYHPFRCIYCATCVQTCLDMAITQETVYAPPSDHKPVEVYRPANI